jgi:hypothetical protein
MPGERLLPLVVRVVEAGETRTVPIGHALVSEREVVVSLEPLRVVLDGPPAPNVVSAPAAPGPLQDLQRLAERSRRVLADPRKARWHEEARAQLASIEAELIRRHDRSRRAG